MSRGISPWGIACLVLLVTEAALGEYNLYRYDHGRPLLSFAVSNGICVIVQLTAAACGVVAMRRGSKWWALAVLPALVLAVSCYFWDL